MKEINNFKEEYRFLSNFYQCDFEYDGILYHNAETAFQAQKCKTIEERKEFALLKNPVMAKRKGRAIKDLDVVKWNKESEEIMYQILKCKFNVPELKEKLLDTGDALLIEGNKHHDNKWGSCMCEACKNKNKSNLLGNILMRIRKELK